MFKQRVIDKLLQLPLAQKAALLCSALCFCSSLVLILASLQSDRLLIQQSSELFGDSLIRQLAIDASNPLVQGDKLSLQSLLKKLVKSQLVMHGAIYDVANRPLAEAGTELHDGQSISASITFQDSIAGYAVITLDTQPLQQQTLVHRWQLVLLALLLSGLAYVLSLLPARYISSLINDLSAIASIPASKRKTNIQINYPGQDELQYLARQLIKDVEHLPDSTNTATGCAVVAFELINLEELRTDLSPSALQQHLTRIEQQLLMICRLYNGVLSINGSSNLCISFNAGSDQDPLSYPFRAMCCAYLMMLWQQQQPLPLFVHAGVAMDSRLLTGTSTKNINQQLQARVLAERATALASLNQPLVAETQLIKHPRVINCVITTSVTDTQAGSIPADTLLVKNLISSYEQVIQKQLHTLQAKLEP